MNDYEFKAMLRELGTIEQGVTWLMVMRRWISRPKSRTWLVHEAFPVIYVIG